MNSNSSPPDDHEPVALITGTSSGFGLLTALTLARRGYRVIATMRDLGRQTELLQQAEQAGVLERIHLMTLDVTDEASIASALQAILGRFGRVDVLVNNAGFAVGGFVEEVGMAEWRRQMETNFFGLIAVTKAVLPLMREQRSGLIINVSSVSGLTGFPGYGPYAASKFAVEGFSESLRQEMLSFGVRVVLVEPGSFRTPIWGKGIAGIHSREGSPYQTRLEEVLRYSRRASETAPDPQEVAELIGRITAKRAPRLRYPVGRGSRVLILGKALLPWKLLEGIISKSLRAMK
ncbi:SDR family oxidoreductase [Paenibacillus tritici]|uniref:SDR family oxidoreductase n=1 Tax=Paenibacillus tritici TaxID=1873425 RepID=A0ABX2DGE8_9BACL|nr:SDR family oxidoreductase [Paenibacillus tritici]NQX43707.1 SDR family oxidoreductase [Paenibacillus tritici]QUL57270.1 SDR family oxidoreductase [Paenibacillus tritici]